MGARMKKRIIISVSAILVITLLLSLLQLLVIPKYTDNKEGALVSEYYGEAFGHDLIFVGGSCFVVADLLSSLQGCK